MKPTLFIPIQKSYKSFKCLISQEGENIPTCVILENDFGIEPDFSRDEIGIYSMTFPVTILTEKTFYTPGFTSLINNGFGHSIGFVKNNESNFGISSSILSSSGSPDNSDGVLNNTPFGFDVYEE